MAGIMMMHMSHKPAVAVASGTSIRDLLSAAGQTAYDAATSGRFFKVSSTDYAAVYTGIAGTSKIGMSDAQLNQVGTGWSANYTVSLPQNYSTVPADNYIVGFVTGISTGTPTISYYASGTFKGTYTLLAGAGTVVTPSTSGLIYFLRKAPSKQAATTYVAINSTGGLRGSTDTWNIAPIGGYSTNNSTWSNWTGSMPSFQSLITTTAVT